MTSEIKENLTAKEIAEAVGGKLIGDGNLTVESITTDSRDVRKKSLFLAVNGEHFDGHEFIMSAVNNGASCVISEREITVADSAAVIVVKNSIDALGKLACEYKKRINPLTVAVTGSIGKTTTKEFIYAVLSEKYKTLKTEENHNNNIGMPMTLLELDHSVSAAVIEMGMNHFGELRVLSQIARPNVAVITNIGTSHIGNLGSREGIRDAKLEILCGLQPGGAIILNGDEPLLSGIEGACYVGKVNRESDVFVDNIISGINGSAFDLTIRGEKIESIVIPAFGEHNVMNAAMAYTVGIYAGMGEFEIRRGLRNYHTVGMRQNMCEKGGRHIIEDCYNASPESVKAALSVLKSQSENRNLRSVAVLGNMCELGDYSISGHAEVGKYAAETNLGQLFTFGEDAHVIADSAVKSGMNPNNVMSFDCIDDVSDICNALTAKTDESDLILFKASRAVKLERIINKLEESNEK